MWIPNNQAVWDIADELILKRKKQKALQTIGINFVLIALLLVLWYFFLYPKVQEAQTLKAETVSLIETKEKLKKQWLTTAKEVTDLSMFLKKTPKDVADFNAIVNSNSDILSSIITKKEANIEYIPWLETQILNSNDLKKQIEAQTKIIENIIPSMGDNTLDYQKKPLTMRRFVEYVETILFSRFWLENYTALWIPEITFLEKDGTIGTFDLAFTDLKWTNKNLLNFIKYIQCSGYDKVESLPAGCPQKNNPPKNPDSSFDNLLISISNLQFSKPITNETEKNSVTIQLRFYVKWIDKKDILLVKKDFQTSIQKLKETIDKEYEAASKCRGKACQNVNEKLSELSKLKSQIEALNNKISELAGTQTSISQQVQDLTLIKNGITQIRKRFDTLSRQEINLKVDQNSKTQSGTTIKTTTGTTIK